MSWSTDITAHRLQDARTQRRARQIAMAREVEAMARDAGDEMVRAAAVRCIQALGWLKRPDSADVALVREFAEGVPS